MTTLPRYLCNWPGKSPIVDGGPEHPAVYHMIDVAAVAERLIAPERFDQPVREALILLTALHDLGKIGKPFRDMLREGKSQGNARHWQVSEALLAHHHAKLMYRLGGAEDVHFLLYAAVSGHHGRPPSGGIGPADVNFRTMMRTVGEDAKDDAGTIVDVFADLWPDASLDGLREKDASALTWWLPGFVATADWIGSNTDWFPPAPPTTLPVQYLDSARELASQAVAEAGLSDPAASHATLFDFAQPRPMQMACQSIPLPEGPTLALIEDETGSGKTEAALMLAQRMLTAGKGRGLYFALPTMATADAMFARAETVVAAMFADPPSLTLAHGRAALSQPFRDVIGRDPMSRNEPTCTSWLADNRRRALLATVGVGTIDQALLGVLPTRFSTLRLYGLASKILIVDEAHEMGNPYMAAELERLLQAHRMAGGSAIVLTATLPMSLRARLLETYGGAGDDPAYPALTIADGAAKRDFPQTRGARGVVAVKRLAQTGDALDLLAQSALDGAACLWVRNAVDDAIAAADALAARGVTVDLLHARFALFDRKRIEGAALARFGKARAARPGRVLVATQVVESSLDLDFDVMVSDLAPAAALIQRAGRLWRHMDLRPADARAVPAAVLHVVSPDPDAVRDARWLADVLDKGCWTYPLSVQWRTAKAVFEAGEIDAPTGLRGLVEASDAQTPVPAAIEDAELERLGTLKAEDNHARQNLVDLDAGFREGGAGADDTDYPTRLGHDQRVLMLARQVGDHLVPWAAEPDMSEVDSCQLSEVQISETKALPLDLPDQSNPLITELCADWPDWKRKVITVCPVSENGTICPGLHYDEDRGILFGSPV